VFRYSEIACLIGLVFVFAFGNVQRLFGDRDIRHSVIALLAMGSFQLVSDFVNSRELLDILKGHANFGFALTSCLFMVVIFRNKPKAFLIYLLAKSAGALILKDEFQTSEQILSDEYWDIRVGFWAAPLVIASSLFFVSRYKTLVVAGLFVYGGAAVVYGGRSHGMTYLFAGSALLFATSHVRERIASISAKAKQRIARFAFVGVVALSLFFPIYVYFGLNGFITDKAQRQLQQIKNPYNPFEVLMAGRGGIEIGANAFINRPILGYGSRAYNADYLNGFALRKSVFDYNFIHSMIFESFAFGGFAVGVCYLLILFFLLRRCANLASVRDNRCVFIAGLFSIIFVWSSLANPLASFRLIWPFAFAATYVFDREITQFSKRNTL
jgi:hypothetical protein